METIHCPIAGCHWSIEVSDEDPDATLSDVVDHFRSYFSGGHRMTMDQAMATLSKVGV